MTLAAGAELTLVLADGCHLVHGQPAGLRGVAGLAHFGGVERVKRDAMAVGIVENLLEPVGVTRVTKPVVTSRTDFLPGSGPVG